MIAKSELRLQNIDKYSIIIVYAKESIPNALSEEKSYAAHPLAKRLEIKYFAEF
jgi:hypothetical protein